MLLDPWTILKTASMAKSQREAAAHVFIQKHTSVPVPILFDSWTDASANIGYLCFSVVPGEPLDTAWPIMTPDSQARTAAELRAYIAEIRALQQPTPAGWIGSVGKKGVICPRIGMHGRPCGPWESEAAFNAFLLKPLDKVNSPKWQQKFTNALASYNHRIVFSHADLSPENVIVNKETGEVTGIIDWEMAGWWPEYWEYRKAMYGGRSSLAWWTKLLDDVMEKHWEKWGLDSDLENFT
ncbi:hypothetical protein C0995_000722 [Termitomyces sp. Mi166|nr:hypothetical protein C0995_000722 [Termitomyces sp. Mi166\